MNIENEMCEVVEEKDAKENKAKEKFAWEKGGLYSRIPKTKKSLLAINIVSLVLGLGLIGLFIALIV